MTRASGIASIADRRRDHGEATDFPRHAWSSVTSSVVGAPPRVRLLIAAAIAAAAAAVVLNAIGAVLLTEGLIGSTPILAVRWHAVPTQSQSIIVGLAILAAGSSVQRCAAGAQFRAALWFQRAMVMRIVALVEPARMRWGGHLDSGAVTTIHRACSGSYRVGALARQVLIAASSTLQVLVLSVISVALLPLVALPMLALVGAMWVVWARRFKHHGIVAVFAQQRQADASWVVIADVCKGAGTVEVAAEGYAKRMRHLQRRDIAGENARVAVTLSVYAIAMVAIATIEALGLGINLSGSALVGGLALLMAARHATGFIASVISIASLLPYADAAEVFIGQLETAPTEQAFTQGVSGLIFAPG